MEIVARRSGAVANDQHRPPDRVSLDAGSARSTFAMAGPPAGWWVQPTTQRQLTLLRRRREHAAGDDGRMRELPDHEWRGAVIGGRSW